MGSVAMKNNNPKWEDLVKEARQFVANYDKTRWKIADLAIRACDIHHGKKDESIYTIARFAIDIGMSKGTLSDWVRVRRLVLDKLPKEIQKNPSKHGYSYYKEVAEKVEFESPATEVRELFEQEVSMDHSKRRFIKYYKHLKTILYNAERPELLKDLDKVQLNKFMVTCSEIHRLLKKELDLREKKPQVNKKALNIKAEIAKLND